MNHTRTTFALAIVAAGFVATPRVARALPLAADHACIGRWVGEGRNTGSSTSWTIDLTLSAAPSGGRCGTIEYTNPACGGTLETCQVVDGDIHTREAYTHTDGRCAPAGRVIIRCEGDRMRYSWIGWERVDSVLHRPGGTPSASPPTPAQPPTGPRPAIPGPPPTPPSQGGQAQPPRTGPGPAPRPLPPAQPRSTSGCAVTPGSTSPLSLALLLAPLLLRRRRFRGQAPKGRPPWGHHGRALRPGNDACPRRVAP